ncbi:MAG: hypothetical protein ACO2ZL_05810, partial [Flavobacteriales bacterium]
MTPLQQTHRLFRDLQDTLHARSAEGDGGVLLSFAGSLTTEIHDALMMMAENALNRSGAKRKLVHRISSTLVECLQNVSRHGWVDDTGQIHIIEGGSPFGTIIRTYSSISDRSAEGLAPSIAGSGVEPNLKVRLPHPDSIPGNLLVRAGFDRLQGYQNET